MNNYLRPDEIASQSEIKKAKGRTEEIKSALGHAASFGTSALGISAAGKVLPFLSQYIPEELALKGIKKVAPAIGRYIDQGMEQGLSLKSGLDFIKSEFERKRESKEQPKEDRNIIQQYAPELHQFIEQEIKGGRSPIEAGAIAQNDKRFKSIIEKMSKDHKIPWSNILESVYGQGQQSQQEQPQEQMQQQQQGQQQSQGLDPAVAQLLQQGQQILSRFKGNRG